MVNIQFQGLLVGLCAFLTVGAFHPIVIKVEYYFSRRVWWIFALAAAICLSLSLYSGPVASEVLGVLGAALAWSSLELHWQHQRVARGRAKRNPKRPIEFYTPSDKVK